MTMRGGCRRARRLDGAYRRSTAGGRAEEIQRGRGKSSSKPRVSHIPQGLANAGAVISRKIPAILRADGNWKRWGLRREESRNGCPPPARLIVRMNCIIYRNKTYSGQSCKSDNTILSNHPANALHFPKKISSDAVSLFRAEI